MKKITGLLNNEKGFSQIQVFLVLIIPIAIILSLITVIGEYWYRNTALDNANKQFVATVCKKGEQDIETTIDNYIDNLESILGANNFDIVLQGKINGVDVYNETIDYLVGRSLGRSHDRQDSIAVYVESKNKALLSNIVNMSIGWFSYTKDSSVIKYSSLYKGEIEPWLDE